MKKPEIRIPLLQSEIEIFQDTIRLINLELTEAKQPNFLKRQVEEIEEKLKHFKRLKMAFTKALTHPDEPVIILRPIEKHWLAFQREFEILRDNISTFSQEKLKKYIQSCQAVIEDNQNRLDYFDKNTRPKIKGSELKRKLQSYGDLYEYLKRHKGIYERQLQLLLIYLEEDK